jgi:cobalt-zinc-cadmium efflux system outer membrane protein
MRWLILLAMLVMPAWGARAEVVGEGAAPTDDLLQALVAEALDRSEELAALRSRIEAAEAMVRPAGALPDPMAMVGLSNIPVGSGLQVDQDMMSSVMLSLSQEVPPGSRRRLMREAQGDEAAMMRAQVEDTRNDIVRRVKRAYIDAQYREAALSVAERNREVAKEMLATAEALYATGKAMQQDVFQAQVRVSQMVDMVVMQRREREAAATRLNRLLYRPTDQPLPALPPLAMRPLGADPEALRARALEANPSLRAMEIGVERSQKEEGVAASMIEPHLTFSFSYMIRQQMAMNPDSGNDMWSASVGMNLPWFRRRDTVDREVEAAQAMRRAMESEVQAMRNELPAMAEEMLIDIARTEEQLALLETGLMPQAEGAYAASRASYATGKGELLDLLDNQMNLYTLELQRAMLLAERERALAELEYVVGGLE